MERIDFWTEILAVDTWGESWKYWEVTSVTCKEEENWKEVGLFYVIYFWEKEGKEKFQSEDHEITFFETKFVD